jgi:hypothetical protein
MLRTGRAAKIITKLDFNFSSNAKLIRYQATPRNESDVKIHKNKNREPCKAKGDNEPIETFHTKIIRWEQ